MLSTGTPYSTSEKNVDSGRATGKDTVLSATLDVKRLMIYSHTRLTDKRHGDSTQCNIPVDVAISSQQPGRSRPAALSR